LRRVGSGNREGYGLSGVVECTTAVNNIVLGERKGGIVGQGISRQGIKDVVGTKYNGKGKCAKSDE